MLNDIMDAVTRRLGGLFGDGCRVYTDPVGQGLEEPCFFVQFLEPSEKPMVGRRFFRESGMSIQYLPGEAPEIQRELNRVADILMDGMGYIQLPDGRLLRGTGMGVSADLEGAVLTFLVSYNMFAVRPEAAEEPMGELLWKGVPDGREEGN